MGHGWPVVNGGKLTTGNDGSVNDGGAPVADPVVGSVAAAVDSGGAVGSAGDVGGAVGSAGAVGGSVIGPLVGGATGVSGAVVGASVGLASGATVCGSCVATAVGLGNRDVIGCAVAQAA